MNKFQLTVIAGALALASATASANEFKEPLENLAKTEISALLANEAVISAVSAQNSKNAALDQAGIDKLDKQWRAEVGNGDGPLISEVLKNALSAYLQERKDAAGGLFTEIFVMDNKGLNVGQSDVTSDYWQGDEAKWKKTFLAGAAAVHISDVELDESTQTYQSQVSVSITDPASGAVIGAATFGVDVSAL